MCGVLNCVRGVHPLVNHHKPPPSHPPAPPNLTHISCLLLPLLLPLHCCLLQNHPFPIDTVVRVPNFIQPFSLSTWAELRLWD